MKKHLRGTPAHEARKAEMTARRDIQRAAVATKRRYHIAGENGASKYVHKDGKVCVVKKPITLKNVMKGLIK